MLLEHGQDSAPLSLKAPAQLTQPVHHVWYAHFLLHWVTHTAPLPTSPLGDAGKQQQHQRREPGGVHLHKAAYAGRLTGLAGEGGEGCPVEPSLCPLCWPGGLLAAVLFVAPLVFGLLVG